MAKRTVDDLLEALKIVAVLKDTVGQHDQAIARILDRLERLEARVAAISQPSPS